jgi:glycosyltransferase involved in cell wall biosynthesis
LEQLAWADEVIVMDSFSQDKTVEIAQTFGVKILQRKYDGPANQKNWAIPQAQNSWVLILDADERLTPNLIQEIKTFLQSPSLDYAGYWIGRQNYFMGQKIKYSGWQGDAVIRLIQRDLCRYNDKQVHEEIESSGKIGRLKHPLNHYTYKDLLHFMAKMERYAVWSAADYLSKTPKVTLFHLWIKPLFRFMRHFIFKRGFLDGYTGFIISSIMAWGVFMRYARIKEIHRLKK